MLFAIMLVYAIVLAVAMYYLLPETNRNRDPHLIAPHIVAGNYLTLLGDRRFLAPALLMCCVLGGLYTMPSLLPFVLIGKLGLTPLQYGLAMLAQTMALMAGNLIAGRMMRRASARRLIPFGVFLIGLAGLAFGCIRFTPLDSLPLLAALPVFMGPAALWIFGLPFITAGAMTLAMAPFPKFAGAASAMVGFLQMGGGFLGSAIAAALFSNPVGAIDTLMPAIALCVGIAYFFLPRAPLGASDLAGD
jgi:DHA1 family bicyclomycin/chloramphenicol resistance-like MFS transporter